jgi:biotin carboxyl carrier protein
MATPEPAVTKGMFFKAGPSVFKSSLLEAMKMENIIKSPTEGVIKKIHAIKGNAVEKNQLLISFQ